MYALDVFEKMDLCMIYGPVLNHKLYVTYKNSIIVDRIHKQYVR